MSEQAIKRITNLLENFVNQTIKEVVSTQAMMSDGGLKWKNKITGPTLEILNSLIKYYTRMIPNYSLKSKSMLKPLSDLRKVIDQKEQELELDGTAIIGIDKIFFPKSSNDEVYIGLLDEKGERTGQGALTNGDILYKGYWEKDMKNGFGVQVYEDGWVFEGHWDENVPKNGRWMVGDDKWFYGFIHKQKSIAKTYRIGFSQKDKKQYKTNKNVKNILYWKKQSTNLMNVKINQKIIPKALEGVSKKYKDTEIEWVHGVKYKGDWEDFKPRLIGVYSFPKNKFPSVKVLGKPKFLFAINNALPDHDPIEGPINSLYNKINKTPGRHFKIEFKGGISYDGAVNENFEFEGLGTLKAPESAEFKWLSKREDKEITGLFLPNQGFVVEFIFEEAEQEMERNLKKVSHIYFKNREKVLRLCKSITGVKYDWITMRGKTGKIVRYKGGWKDYAISGSCLIQIDDGPVMDRIAQNGIIFNANIKLSRYKDFKSNADDHGKIKIKKEIKFINGYRYKGGYNIEKQKFRGFGILTSPDKKIKKRGYWRNSMLKLDLDYFKINREEIRRLDNGEYTVNFYNGVRFSGMWEDYDFKHGKVTLADGTEEDFIPGKDYLQIPKPVPFQSKLILFNWSKFKFEKARSLRINQKIVMHQQKYLEPLIHYGMATLLKKEHITNKMPAANTNYTKYPMVSSFVNPTAYNFDHLEKRFVDDVVSDNTSDDGNNDENNNNLNELRDEKEFNKMFKKMNRGSNEEAFFGNTDSTLDLEAMLEEEEEDRKKKEEESKKIKTFRKRIVINEEDEEEDNEDEDQDDDSKDSNYDENDDKEDEEIEKEINKGSDSDDSDDDEEDEKREFELENEGKGKSKEKAKQNTEERERIQKEEEEDIMNNPDEGTRQSTLEVTREGMVKTTVDLFSQMSRKEIDYEYKKSLLEDPNIRRAMFMKHRLNGVADVGINHIKFFNGDVYKFQNNERGFMHSLGSLEKYKHVIWNGAEDRQAEYVKRHFYWSLFFSKIEFTNFDDEYFEKALKNKILHHKFTNLKSIRIRESDQTIIQGNFMDCKLVGFASVTTKAEREEYKLQKAKKKLLRGLNIHTQASDKDKKEEFFWFDDQIYSEITDLQAIERFRKVLKRNPIKGLKYTRKLYNLLKPLKEFYNKWKKAGNTGDEARYFMIDFPDEFKKERVQDFLIKYDGEEYSSFSQIVDNIDVFQEGTYRINYPNGDIFIGRKNKRMQSCGEGEYRWRGGYKYEGSFNVNVPFGEGEFTDCMGGKITGFFLKGYLLKEGYGLMRLINVYNKKIKRDTKHDLDIIFDPVVMKKASKRYIGEAVKYRKIFKDVSDSKKMVTQRIDIVRDGELNYTYDWDEKIRIDIITSLIQDEDDRIFKSSKKRRKKKKMSIAPGRPNLSLGSVNSLDSKLKELEDMNKQRDEQRYKWIKKIQPIFVTRWQKEQLVELVKDQDVIGVGITFRHFLTKGFPGKFFNLTDEKNRNIVMISAFFGYRSLFSDLLAAMKYCQEEKKISVSTIRSILKKRDTEGNNIVDLACIRGFSVEEDYIISKKIHQHEDDDSDNLSAKNSIELRKESQKVPLPDLPLLPTSTLVQSGGSKKQIEVKNEYKTSKNSRRNSLQSDSNMKLNAVANKIETKNERAQRLDKTSVEKNLKRDMEAAEKRDNVKVDSFDLEIFQRMFLRLEQDVTKLFTSATIKSNEKLYQTYNEVKGKTTSDLVFLTRRAACLKLLFAYCRIYKMKHILKKKHYDKLMNNPLHYTIHKGDLHSTLILLEEENDMIFWRNEKLDVASQVIKYAGENYAKSLATFASILHEVTRQFNFSVISDLFIDGGIHDGKILQRHLDAVGVEENDFNAKKWIKSIKVQKFIPEENYLYQNNFIMLSDELCYQYVEMLKERSMVYTLKQEYTLFKYHVYDNISIFESLQRNFLDYFKGSIDNYYSKKVCNSIRAKVKRLLCWYVFVFGEVDIKPEIYDLLGIDPFEKILDGKNIFHFMCEYNSSNSLGTFLSYLYERCHTEPYDRTRKTFDEWNKTLDPKKYDELLKKFNIKTDQNQQTPAHLCAINQSYNCLELLMKHHIDIEEVNLRGRTVVEILLNSKRNRDEALTIDNEESIEYQLFKMIKEDILITCKRHSLIREFIAEAEEKDFSKIFNRSKYELYGELKKVRWEVRDRVGKYTEKYKEMLKRQDILMESLSQLVQIERYSPMVKVKKLADLRREYIKLNAKSKKKISRDKKLQNERRLKQLEYLISGMSIKKLIIVPKERIMTLLFSQNFLRKIKHFKYKKIEKFIKIELHNKILKHDFINPVPSSFKYFTPKLGLFGIQVLLKPNEAIESNVVVKQVHNIKEKYRRFGGGIKIDMIKGFRVRVRTRKYLWMCKETFDSWFIVITVSHELLMKFAYDEQMDAYNMRNRYHTVFSKGSIDEDDLEPLKHSQKVHILMNLIKNEFDISGTMNRNLVVKYFPLHDYRMLNLIMNSWKEHWFLIHFKDIFYSTHKNLMKVISMIAMYHGVQQGFYFGFLSVYTNSLFWLALMGIGSLVVRLLDFTRDIAFEDGDFRYFQYITTLAPFFTGIWSTVFINTWRRREIELSYGFDVFEEENVKQVRDKYRGQATISENTKKITKKAERRTLLMLFYNVGSFSIGFGLIVGIYYIVSYYNALVDGNQTLDEQTKTAILFAIGAVNGTLNFFLSVLYEKLVDYLVYTENHIYRKQYLDSMIMKKVTFKLISTLFTLIAQTLIERQTQAFVSIQVSSNLLTSAALNYGINVLIPVYDFYVRRYHIKTYLLTCGCCCKKRMKRGKLEDFKEEMILKMLSNPMTKDSFERYCLNEEISEEMKKKVKEYGQKTQTKALLSKLVRNVENQVAKPKEFKIHPRVESNAEESTPINFNRRVGRRMSTVQSREEKQKRIFQATVKNIESVSEETYSYNPGPESDLGKNKHQNIKLRLRENFARYVLSKEKIIETSYMLNLESLEEGFYSSLLMQYSFICFFSPFLMSAGLISWIINILIIVLTMLIYTGSTTRPVSRRTKDIGIWNNIFNFVGYIGVLYNSVVIVRYSQGASLFFDFGTKESETEMIYIVQGGILIFKFLLSISVQNLPKWINDSIVREKMEKQRAIELNSKVLNRLYKEAARKNKALNEDGTIDQSFYDGQEAADLRYFFKNDNKIVNANKLEFGENLSVQHAPNIKVMKVEIDD